MKITVEISRLKFGFFFVLFAFPFLFATSSFLDQQAEAFLGPTSQAAWQSAASIILSPVKLILLGPLVPFIKFLNQDPDTPPPFFLAGFAFYWTILALAIHFLISKISALS